MNEQVSIDQLTVDNCDREPIHIPGLIQPFGTLLAGAARLTSVDYAAENLHQIFGVSVEQALNSQFAELFPSDILHDIRNLLAYSTASSQRERVGTYQINGRQLEIFAHLAEGGNAIVELEEIDSQVEPNSRAPVERARLYLAQASAQREIDKFLRVAAIGLQELTGFDRVKAYRYAADGSGEVVAEARNPDVPSFLGHRYPAWDVPTQARVLQVRNPVRMIADVDQTRILVRSRNSQLLPLDMSLAHLRGISPIHVEYLKNMGVKATLTIGLVVDGKLWGMFSCHHMSPKVVGSDSRIAAELFGQMVSLLIKERLENEKAQARSDAAAARQRILAETDATVDLLRVFPATAGILKELIDCDGIAVLSEDDVRTEGSVPSENAIRAIGRRSEWDENLIEGTDNLEKSGWHQIGNEGERELNDTAGCLIVRAAASHPLQIMFFRDEVLKSVTWAGKPEKTMSQGPYGPRITPRGSFEAYVEEQRDRSNAWSAFDFTSAREIQVMLTQISAKSEREQLVRQKDLISHQRQQDILIAELNHRVKNILALIRSLSRQAKDSSTSLDSYALALEQRITALASAHDLAVSDSMKGVSLRGILDTELGPYIGKGRADAILSGPVVGLRPEVAPMIALVLHELVSNAVKHGALSSTDGVVQVRWQKSDDGLTFNWSEMGGPSVSVPNRHGFGRSLIEKAIPFEFDGTVDLNFDSSGLSYNFTLPAEHLLEMKGDSTPKVSVKAGEVKQVACDKTVLLIEDNVILAMDMAESLSRLGAVNVHTLPSITAGLESLESAIPDFAVLDMSLRGEVAWDLALKLCALKIPFIFVTGYSPRIDVPEALQSVPLLTKPVDDATLSQGIERVLS